MVFYTRPIEESLQAIARCGFDYVEIWLEHLWQHGQPPSPPKIKDLLAQTGLKATVHCPIMDLNITSPNPRIREESIRQTVEAAGFAAEIGARLMVLHPGHRFSAKEEFAVHWKRQIQAIRRIVREAAELGTEIALENMEIDSPKATVKDHTHLRRIKEDAQLPNLGLTLDTAHLRDSGKIVEFIESLGQDIIHTHISDSTAQKLHLQLGEGDLDFRRIVKALQAVGYAGVYSLETFIPGDEEILRRQRAQLASYCT